MIDFDSATRSATSEERAMIDFGTKEEGQPAVEQLAYTAKEAASLLAISERLLWTLTNSGKIRAARIGRAVRYSRAELIRFLTEAESN